MHSKKAADRPPFFLPVDGLPLDGPLGGEIMKRHSMALAAAFAAFGATSSHAEQDLNVGMASTPNAKPAFLGAIKSACYDGVTNDLLTAGLGKTGLAGAAPAFANPLAPTALELRRNAIHTNYRAVLDITAGGGYGTFYGPNVLADGTVTSGEGKIAGCEHLAYADDGSGHQNVTLMVQIPATFNANNACIVTGTSSGSRGIYGAIGASGEWGLKRGCAVAYTDKGSGNGLHDLMTDAVGVIDGTRMTAATAGPASHFTANLSDAERAAFNAAFPNRVAFKHAHSQQNPEADWGKNTLQAIVFAFHMLNEQLGSPGPQGAKRIVLDRKNTLVIASAVSNGGGGGLLAAEQDKFGLIDGVAVTEPQIQPADTSGVGIMQGSSLVPTIGRPLYDYFTWANLYQPCAALAVPGAPALLFLGIPNPVGATARCAGLRAKGLVAGDTLAAQAADALAKLHAYGWQADSDALHASHYRFATNAIAVTYSNSYGRFSVADNVCGFSMANTDALGNVIAQVPALQAGIFSTGNGVPPATGVNLVYNQSLGGAKLDLLAVSPSSGVADFALDGAICHRNLVEGRDIVTGAPLAGTMLEASNRLREGIAAVQASAFLKNTPTIIVHGRSDALVPVNHASRAYYAKNQAGAAGVSNVRYVEVTNAQHFDAFLPGGAVFGGYENRWVPLHVYLIRALDWMYDHLKNGKALPPSQVVRAVPRGGTPGAAPALAPANVPPIAAEPAAADLITFSRSTLFVPN
jgi:hydroxybutyrate-dimer hydrolase